MFLSGHKSKESYIVDITIISELIKLMYLDRGIITQEQYKEMQSDKHRGRYINAIVERVLSNHALWDLNGAHAYDIVYEEELDLYIAEEFKDIPHNVEAIKLGLYEIDIPLEVMNVLPDVLDKSTWAVWQTRVVGISLIIQNQGDYRAINYFNDDREHMERLKQTYPPEVLFQHD